MLEVAIEGERARIGERLFVSFQRTLRVPDDGKDYPLPPGIGAFPIHRVADYADRVPREWRERGGVFIPMYQREALWLGFGAARWKPNAVKVGVGGINAVSGLDWDEALHTDPQDYIICPQQPWLDGINAGEHHVRQFVAMPLGAGYTVEGQVTGNETVGGIQLLVFEPRPGLFPDQPPPESEAVRGRESRRSAEPDAMGIAPGGRIEQKIYPDPYGLDTWNPDDHGDLFVHIVNTEQYSAITGLTPPPTPISAHTYSERGLPWFALYDGAEADLPAAPTLSALKSVQQHDAEIGVRDTHDATTIDIDPGTVVGLERSERTEA